MERELLLTGIGGQGIQFAAQILARALTQEGRRVMSLGTYGGTMRGGNTDASIVFADGPISAPPIVASAWSALVMHHRFWQPLLHKLAKGAVLLLNRPVFETDEDLSAFRTYDIPAASVAAGIGAEMGASLVMIGTYAKLTGAVQLASLIGAMERALPPYRRTHAAQNQAFLEAGFAHVPAAREPAFP